MKIAYIAGWPIPSRAANAVHVMKMCQAYAHNGHDISLIHPAGSHDDLKDIDDLFEHYGVEQNFEMFPDWNAQRTVRITKLCHQGREARQKT